jgi:methionyl-tRNA formyltransferase
VNAPLRLLFAGTPEIACFSLEALLADTGGAGTVVGVLTNPDRPAGRKRIPTPPPVKTIAREAGIPVLQPERLDADARRAVRELAPDLLVTVAYGKIFGPRFMALFPRGGINLHPSLLPRHRGPSPLQAAIRAGDTRTGVTIQAIAPEMDSGAIILQEEIPLGPRTTAAALHDDLGARGARLLTQAVKLIAAGEADWREQEHSAATWCHKITKQAGAVTWQESAEELDRMVRAYTPWPGVRCGWEGETLQITEAVPVPAAVGEERPAKTPATPPAPGTVLGVDNRFGILVQTTDGLLAVRRLKPQARNEVDFQSFLNGNRGFVGTVLTQA